MRYLIIIALALAVTQSEARDSDSLSIKLLHQEMVYWQAQSDSVRFYALLSKARLDRNDDFYDNALNELFRAEKFCIGAKEHAEMNYEKMLNYFLEDDYTSCSEMVLDSGSVADHYNEYLTMKLYSMNEIEKWDKCKSEMIKACNIHDSLRLNEIKELPTTYSYKNPEKCRRMSAILPGLGETYAGYPFKGFTSFVLNGGFLFFAGYNFYTSYYITGVVSGILPFKKLHAGGRRLSAILADEHNEIESGKLKKKYREEISSIIH